MFVIAVGSAFNGIALFGLFNDAEDAAHWAEKEFPCDEWHVINVNMLGPEIFLTTKES